MKHYFIEKKGKKEGPFTYDDLKNKKISDEYKVWSDGLDSWINIRDCDELSDFIIKTPPLTEKELKLNGIYIELKNISIYLLIIHVLFAFAIFIINGGVLGGDELVLVLRNSPKPIFFTGGHQAIIYILLFSIVLALPFTAISGLLFYKKHLYEKHEKKDLIVWILLIGTIILILLAIIYKFYYNAIYSGIVN